METKSTTKDILRKLLGVLLTPYFLGIIITLVAIKLTVVYYYEKDQTDAAEYKSTSFRVLNWINHKGLDFQFALRGERDVSEDIALITVDEKAVEQEGRWPWPRVKIKKIIDNLMKYDSKVIGFDAIFAEEDLNATVLALRELRQNPATPVSMHSLIDASIVKANTDADLAEAVKTYAPKLVMGVFFDNGNIRLTYQNMCISTFFREDSNFKNWDRVAEPILSLDKTLGLFEEDLPTPWAAILTNHKEQIKIEARKKYLEKHKLSEGIELNKTQELELNEFIRNSMLDYCGRWLTNQDEIRSSYKEAWPQISEQLENKDTSFESAVSTIMNTHKINPIVAANNFVFNYPGITENLQHMGYFNAFQDDDGTIRRSSIISRIGNTYFPSLALKTFLVAMGYSAQITLSQDEIDQNRKYVSAISILKEGEPISDIPISKAGELLINFSGPQKMFPHVSVADILNDDPNLNYQQRQFDKTSGKWIEKTIRASKAEFLRGKILLFGATAIGIYDLRVTPFEENYPGLETHANILDNLIQNNFYIEQAREIQIIPALLAVGLICTFLFGYLGAFWGFFWATFGTLGYIFYDKKFMFSKGIVFPIWFPILLLITLYFAITIFKYFTEERNKKMLKSTFQKYVSPAIVNEILSDPDKLELGGRKQKMTVFFSDVRGFTTISEKLDPRALSDLLNSYLTPMTDIVFKNKGTLDKYMGDAVMAFFGAPVFYSDHAVWAARCALEQLTKLRELQAQYRSQGLPEIDIGIGLNTGDMSVGNMGSQTVRNYTVMGDAVNLGSRLEGINKQYGTKIIISEFTEAELQGKFICRELDWVRVKGKLKPVKIYELISEGSTSAEMTEVLKHFSLGYELYHKMQWTKASEAFNLALQVKADDGPSKLYLERCTEYMTEPPSSDWDGVFVMKTK